MSTFSEQELKDILDKHGKWLRNEAGGSYANLSDADLDGADLSGADLDGADLYRVNLSGANLSDANLSAANLSGANLYSANLFDANLSYANLSYANLSDANLSDANLYGANLSRANLDGANLSGTIYKDNIIVNFMYQKHTAIYFGTDEIRIGCRAHPIKHWVDNFEEIGKKENYNDEQIKRYGKFIKSCAEDFAGSKK